MNRGIAVERVFLVEIQFVIEDVSDVLQHGEIVCECQSRIEVAEDIQRIVVNTLDWLSP